jgi:transposase-like protein
MNHKNSLKNLACPNGNCPHFRKHRQGNIIRHSFYKTSQGRRRRYRCRNCGRTFSSTYGTAYYRLQNSRTCFDDVATMSVNGIGKSAISRIKNMSWNTVDRWLHQTFLFAQQFNAHVLHGYEIIELQADEIRTFVGGKKKVRWVFTALVWVGLAVGSRTYKNVKRCLLDVLHRGCIYGRFLFTTDGVEMYRWLVDRYLAGACIYGQVIKKRRKNRVTTVRRTPLCGTREQLEDALLNSEDSSTLNTSFVDRHNLTIRQGSSILCRRTAAMREKTALLRSIWSCCSSTTILCGLIPLCGLVLRCGLQRCKLVWRVENCASVMSL